MTSHSRLSPSAASTWAACPGYVQMVSGRPKGSTPASEEGTRAHEQAAALLRCEDVLWGKGEAEMRQHVEKYISTVLGLAEPESVHVEQRVDIDAIHETCWGTVDAWWWAGDTLHVMDFKYGHQPVSPERNWQLISYAAGLPAQDYALHIYQPRAWDGRDALRSWSVTRDQLRPYVAKLRAAAHAALGESPALVAGRHCKYCPARGVCPALREDTALAADYAGPEELTVDEQARELSYIQAALGRLQWRATALSAELETHLRAGRQVGGWMLKPGRGQRSWIGSAEQELPRIGDLLGIDIAPRKLLTPAQAEKAGLPKDVVKAYAETTAGAPKLTEVDINQARGIFGHE